MLMPPANQKMRYCNMSDTIESPAVHIPVEHQAAPKDDFVANVTSITTPLAARVALEKGLAHGIRQMLSAVDGFTALAFIEQDMTSTKSPLQHALDEVGGVDGMRVTFRGQTQHILSIATASEKNMQDRHKVALKICKEHLRRSEEFGQWLTEKTAPAACQECLFFLQALHLVLKPYTKSQRDTIYRAYMTFRDPTAVVPY